MVTGIIEKQIRNFRLKIHLKINLKFALLSWVCVCVWGGGGGGGWEFSTIFLLDVGGI